jgi:pimeloyl-ACP methyl ester carboxylesterase
MAQWLAMSTEPAPGGGVRFALDKEEIRALLMSYFATDLWPTVESPPDASEVHLVIGDRSTSYSPADRKRALQAAARQPRVTVDVLPTGHYVHTEDPDGLLRVLLQRISS